MLTNAELEPMAAPDGMKKKNRTLGLLYENHHQV
jgi:hypothetical protein